MLSPPSYACLSGARPIRQTTSLLGRPHLPAHPSVLALRAIGRRRVTKAAAPAWTGNQDNALILAVRPRPVAFTGWTYLVFEDEMSDSSTSQGPPMSQSSNAESGQLSIKARGRWGRAPSPARRSDAVLSKTSLRLPPTPLRMYRSGRGALQLQAATSSRIPPGPSISLRLSLVRLSLFFPSSPRMPPVAAYPSIHLGCNIARMLSLHLPLPLLASTLAARAGLPPSIRQATAGCTALVDF